MGRNQTSHFRVGVTSGFLKPDGTCGFGDIGLELLNQHGVDWEYFDVPSGEIAPTATEKYDALLLLGARLTQNSLSQQPRLRLVARFGVGYDNVDLAACTERGVLLTITPEGVRRPVAVAALTLLLALTHKLRIKDTLVRNGRWSDRLDHNGQGVTGRTLGLIGFGNIGQELARIVAPLDMRLMAYDPNFQTSVGESLGVSPVGLETLLKQSDYVVICCALTPSTRGLIGGEQLALMQPSAYLINVARGPIVVQRDLTEWLSTGRIAGAGLDVFEVEPILDNDPLLQLENVILTPHAICWTDECFSANGRSAIQSIIDVANGGDPRDIVNREALQHSRWQTHST